MKQGVRNVGKFSASTPSSGSNYLLYSSVESIKTFYTFNTTMVARALLWWQEILVARDFYNLRK